MITSNSSKLAIIIPTLNEEQAIINLVKECIAITDNVVVVDGLSTDETVIKAKEAGAEVIFCKEKGKGWALIAALKDVLKDSEISHIAYLDGDSTYDPKDVNFLLKKIVDGNNYDMVIGNRFPKRDEGTIKKVNMIGNKVFSMLVNIITRQKIDDTQSGLRIVTREVAEFLSKSLKSRYFEIETEMIIKAAKRGYKIGEVPISYRKRDGETKLKPFRDGLKILVTIFKNMF